MTNILIIAFKFPPMGGVGTRRWAKFAKYFAKKGIKVHVLTIDYFKEDVVNWLYDVKDNENIVIHRIKSGYFNFLLSQSNNIWIARFKFIIATLLKNTTHYLDVAQQWHRYMIPYASNLIKEENIKNIIVTSPPHSVAYYATYLKIQYPNINIILDFRDSWNDDIDYEYDKNLNFKQKEKSVYMEWFALTYSNYIVNVSKDSTARIKEKFKHLPKDKFITIYNGYDMDDFVQIKLNNNNLSMVYAGSLGVGRDKGLSLLCDALLELNDEYIKNNFKLYIYSELDASNFSDKYNSLINRNIFFYDKVSSDKILNLIAKNSYCLTINSEFYSYAFGTKVFDYMALKKKIFLISNGGELYDILKSNNQFVSDYTIDNMKKAILDIKEDFLNNKIHSVNYDKFNIVNLIENFERLFI